MLAVLCFVAAQTQTAPDIDRHLYQIGSYSALRSGQYDGTAPISSLVGRGNFGVGTFNGLDGEMVILDGDIVHVDSSGNVDCPRLSVDTPFACTVRFVPDIAITLENACSQSELEALVDAQVKDPAQILAVRIDGSFSGLQARCFAPQVKPYLPLAKIKDGSNVLSISRIDGTFVGFRMPKDIGPDNVPGYHFHFVDRPGTRAGEVMSYRVDAGTVRIMLVDRNIVHL